MEEDVAVAGACSGWYVTLIVASLVLGSKSVTNIYGPRSGRIKERGKAERPGRKSLAGDQWRAANAVYSEAKVLEKKLNVVQW